MDLSIVVIVLILALTVAVTLAVISVIKYLDKRDTGKLRLSIKLKSFELVLDSEAEKIIKKSR